MPLRKSLRASRAIEESENRELLALELFFNRGCEVVPKLLGFQQGKQDEDEGAYLWVWIGISLVEPEKWDDYFFFQFALALRSRKPIPYIPSISSNEADWVEDDNGCIW
ncbi:hypothetical protein N7491_009072 [Penicillium cf. griseofulvum]|nr:hypothetical protein N7491_009072 [Penicillium cf. griseofulvum]